MEYDADNRLTTYNGETVTYDLRGNMTHGPLNGRMADYEYDCRNRLVKVTEEDGTVTEYKYDAENTRTAVIKDGIRTEYVVDKNTTYSRILTETNYKKTIFGYTDKVSEKIYTYGAGLLSEQRTGEKGSEFALSTVTGIKEARMYDKALQKARVAAAKAASGGGRTSLPQGIS